VSRIVDATFVNNQVEPGWTILSDHVPLGKRYRVDLDRVERMTMTNISTGKSIPIDAIWVIEPAPPGYMPLMALKIEADA
jgi:hypothetical protein